MAGTDWLGFEPERAVDNAQRFSAARFRAGMRAQVDAAMRDRWAAT